MFFLTTESENETPAEKNISRQPTAPCSLNKKNTSL